MGGLWSQDTILSSMLIAVSCGMGANQLLIFQDLAVIRGYRGECIILSRVSEFGCEFGWPRWHAFCIALYGNNM